MACILHPVRLSVCRVSARTFSSTTELCKRSQLKPRLLDRRPDPIDITEDLGEFEKLFRQSHFAHLGEPRGQRLVAKVIEIREDTQKAYVDYGGKLHAVVDMPKSASRKLTKGDRVMIELEDTEISARLQGAPKQFSILESQARLVRSMRQGPASTRQQQQQQHSAESTGVPPQQQHRQQATQEQSQFEQQEPVRTQIPWYQQEQVQQQTQWQHEAHQQQQEHVTWEQQQQQPQYGQPQQHIPWEQQQQQYEQPQQQIPWQPDWQQPQHQPQQQELWQPDWQEQEQQQHQQQQQQQEVWQPDWQQPQDPKN